MDTPKTRKEKLVEDILGFKVVDPYRWLEDGKSQEVLDWINSQNEHTNSFLKDDIQEAFKKDLERHFKATTLSPLLPTNGRYFWVERKANENRGVLYIKKGLNGEPKELINPNKIKNNPSLDYWFPSFSGKYVAYGLSENGDEMATLYVIDIENGQNLKDKIPFCRYSQVAWLSDDSGFFYTKNLDRGAVQENEEHLHQKVYFHKIGDDPWQDKMIFGEDRPKDDLITLSISIDNKYLAIHVSQNWNENEIYIYDIENKETKPLVVGVPAKFSLQFLQDKAIIYTNYMAENFRIISSPANKLFRKIDEWEEFLPESENLLTGASVTKDKIILRYFINVYSKLIAINHSGKKIGEVFIPEHSSIHGLRSRISEKEFFYSVESFTKPAVIFRFNPEAGKSEEYTALENTINPDDFLVKQEWFTSKDGTRVPMFIVSKKNIELKGKNPTILLGYGGFGVSITPFFQREWLPWLEQGGIFVVANIRGGGEFGEKWHQQGIKENKQNSFDDFIAAAEFLISEKYTSKDKLGMIGGSNGGLLVLATAIQRPDLFSAACAQVPLADAVRFPKFSIASRWVAQYGDPNIKEDLERILKWSPYHNVKEGVEYPSMLITTGENDTRIDPLHSRKMAAILQSTNKKNKIFLFTEKDAGHGPGKPISKSIDNQSLVLNFFTKTLK